MANAKKCDRCGAFYEITETECAIKDLAKALNDFRFKSRKNDNDFIDRFDNSFDVCDMCLRSFGQWWKDGK